MPVSISFQLQKGEAHYSDNISALVTRLLEAGATILGKAVCENLSLCASSFSAATGPVENPHARGYTSGGSSSGCGSLIGGGVVEAGIGGDQGGSIRFPASYCGIVGMKPTWGLVPYTGQSDLDDLTFGQADFHLSRVNDA